MNNCERKSECGFVSWMEKNRGWHNGVSEECGEDQKTCQRTNDIIPIETVGPATEKEWNRALPPIYVSQDGRKRRLP